MKFKILIRTYSGTIIDSTDVITLIANGIAPIKGDTLICPKGERYEVMGKEIDLKTKYITYDVRVIQKP